jgi:hypothetical protein
MRHSIFFLVILLFMACPIRAQTMIYLPVIFKAPESDKRGVGITSPVFADVDRLNAKWYYTWRPDPAVGDSPYNTAFVPRISRREFWDRLPDAVDYAANGSGWLMTLTEPDTINEPCVSPTEAAQFWRTVEATAIPAGVRLVSPTPSQHDPAWLWRMVSEYRRMYGKKPHFDAISWNIYKRSPAEMQGYLVARHNEMLLAGYDVPVWVAEFGGDCTGGYANNVALAQAMLPWLEATPWIGRYAWFANRTTYRLDGTWAGCSLIDEMTGELSPVGEMYRGK